MIKFDHQIWGSVASKRLKTPEVSYIWLFCVFIHILYLVRIIVILLNCNFIIVHWTKTKNNNKTKQNKINTW